MVTPRATSALLAVGIISGCALDDSGKIHCRTTADCLGTDVCHAGLCVDPSTIDAAARTDASSTPDGGGLDASLEDGAKGSGGSAGTGGALGSGGASGSGGADGPDAHTSGGAGNDAGGAPGAGGARDAGDAADSGDQESCGPLTVDADRTGGVRDGSSWTNAFTDLQDALTEARKRVGAGCSEVQIWVAAGRYVPSKTGNRTASFELTKGAAVYGGFAGTESTLGERDWLAHRTVLSGDLAGDDASSPAAVAENSFHVVSTFGASSATVLDGVVVTGGNGDSVSSWGAGILHQSGGGTYRNVLVVKNRSNYVGGGAMVLDGNPRFEDAWFVDNHAEQMGAAIESLGSPVFDGLRVAGNSGSMAMVTGGGGTPRIRNAVFCGNKGALQVASGDLTELENAVIVGNSAPTFPGLFLAADLTARNLTLVGNSSPEPVTFAALELSLTTTAATVYDSILWGNAKDVSDDAVGILRSSLFGGAAGNGNLDADPQFSVPKNATGKWTSAPVFDPGRFQTRLTDSGASFTTAEDAEFVQFKTSAPADPRWAYVAERTQGALWVWGDLSSAVSAGDSYALRSVTLSASSPAIDVGDDAHATTTDARGAPRHDVPGTGTSVSDLGAYEWTSSAP